MSERRREQDDTGAVATVEEPVVETKQDLAAQLESRQALVHAAQRRHQELGALAVERSLTALQEHEARRPQRTMGLEWDRWYSRRCQLQALFTQVEQHWRALDEQTKAALQQLQVARSRFSQGKPRSGEQKRLAEQAERELFRQALKLYVPLFV